MKIQPVKSSEIFDIYANHMVKRSQAKVIDDLLQVIMQASKGTDEYAQALQTLAEAARKGGPEGTKALEALKKGDPALAAKIEQEIAQTAAKGMPAAVSTLQEEANTLRTSARTLDDLATNLKAGEGGTVFWKGKTYNAEEMKKVMQAEAKKAREARASLKKAEEAGQISAENARVFEKQYQIAEAAAAEALAKVDELGKEVARLGGELTGAAKTIAKLESIIGEMDKARKVQTEEMIELSKQLGRYEAIAKGAKEVGEEGTLEYKAITQAVSNLSNKVDDLSKSVAKGNPKAAAVIAEETTAAVQEGAAVGSKQFDEAAKAVGKTKPAAKPGVPPVQKATGEVLETAIKAAPAVGAASGAGGLVSSFASFGLLLAGAGGLYLVWRYLWNTEPDAVQEYISAVDNALRDAIAKLRVLQFKELSNGSEYTNALLESLQDALSALPALNNPNISAREIYEIAAILDEAYVRTDEYLNLRGVIPADLKSEVGWFAAIESLRNLQSILNNFKERIYLAAKEAERVEGGISPDRTPAAKPAERDAGPPVMVEIYGEPINIAHTSAGFRSAAPRLIRSVLNTPTGRAFVDPVNIWGGYITKTGDPAVDYLQSLKYLYQKGIGNESQLRRFMRDKMPKAGRKRHSAWRNAIEYYKAHRASNKQKNIKKNANFPNKHDNSMNSWDIKLNKMADSFSKSYYQDAVKGLDDQYAKSYYTGLRGMYDSKLGDPGADYTKLYEPHAETGAELVGKAHPMSADIAESMGHGGRVENVLEQHRHNTGVALSTPTGNFRQRHAWVIESLVKLANKADEDGRREVSDLIDSAIETLSLEK